MIATALALVLAISPWKGADLPAAATSGIKYRLRVTGAPGSTARLRATNVAPGWIAAFCNGRICSPGKIDQPIPKRGTIVLQFDLIREEAAAPQRSGAIIRSDDGSSVVVARPR